MPNQTQTKTRKDIPRMVSNLGMLKDIDTKQGLVQFYFSGFDNRDRHGDIIVKEAFNKLEMHNDLRHFKNHYSWETPGNPKEVGVDENGAWMLSQLYGKGHSIGTDTLIEYEAGGIKQHSFGFEVLDSEYSSEQDSLIIKDVFVWEASSLTHWGANPKTPMIGLKDASSENIIKMFDVMEKMLKHRDISEEKGKEVENRYEQLKSFVYNKEDTAKAVSNKLKSIFSNIKSF